MPSRLSTADPDFDARFSRLVDDRRDQAVDVRDVVSDILADVRTRGDAAVLELTRKFDRVDAAAMDDLSVSKAELQAALDATPNDRRDALTLAATRIRAFHEAQLPNDIAFTDDAGVRLGARWSPIDSVGLYVPGGKAAYPSSVLMNAIPAKVAGVERLVMVVPTPDGEIDQLVLAAAALSGIDEVWRIGGAQAVGALAFGTDSILAVDKITGPGNAYVAEAKRQVFGTVGIDMIAGPSEILVVADAANDPAWIAADLLSQAEHDEVAQSILITDEASFADNVTAAVDSHLAQLPRKDIAAASWEAYGAIVVVDDLADAPPLVDRLAPEHLELCVDDPEALANRIRHAGAMFLGRYTPEAIGDYVGGPNHVLPTGRSARFSSGLGVQDFMKRTTLLACDADSLRRIGPAAETLAEAEGLDAHGLSVSIRLNRQSDS